MWQRRADGPGSPGRRQPSPGKRRRQDEHTVRAGTASGSLVRLSVFDLLIGPVYSARVFFYRQRLDGAALRASLGRTLRRYPAVAGRLKKDPDGGCSVLCNDAGVRFVETSRPGRLPDFGPGMRAEPEIRRYLCEADALRAVGGDVPLLTVRLTHYDEGGSALGVTINHMLGDGASFLPFLENWSCEHRGLDIPGHCHQPSAIDALGAAGRPDTQVSSELYPVTSRAAQLMFLARIILGARRVATVTVHFEAAELAALKQAAMAELAGTGRWISTNDAFTAHLWQILAELRAPLGPATETLGIVIDLRSRLTTALPERYWGNAAAYAYLSLPSADLRTQSLGTLAEAVRAGVTQHTEQGIRDDIAFLSAQREAGRSGRVSTRMALGAFHSDGAVAINNRARLPEYRTDFGAGPPFWCEYPPVPFPWTVDIQPTPAQDGGRDVHLSLPRKQAAELQTAPWQRRLHGFA